MTQEKRPGQLRLVKNLDGSGEEATPIGKEKSAADTAALENPLVKQLSALADSLDREIAMLLGF